MVRVVFLLLCFVGLIKADWMVDYRKGQPKVVSTEIHSLEKCSTLADSLEVRRCMEEVSNGSPYNPRATGYNDLQPGSREYSYIIDEQTTVVVSGDETTRTVTTIKSRSGRQIAESIDGVKKAIQLGILLSLMLSGLSIIVIFSQ